MNNVDPERPREALSLEDFAEQYRPVGRVCRMCASPHREEIERAFRKGVGVTMIAKWLLGEHGEQWNNATLDNHFRRGHLIEP